MKKPYFNIKVRNVYLKILKHLTSYECQLLVANCSRKQNAWTRKFCFYNFANLLIFHVLVHVSTNLKKKSKIYFFCLQDYSMYLLYSLGRHNRYVVPSLGSSPTKDLGLHEILGVCICKLWTRGFTESPLHW